jgi:hypothetical protein
MKRLIAYLSSVILLGTGLTAVAILPAEAACASDRKVSNIGGSQDRNEIAFEEYTGGPNQYITKGNYRRIFPDRMYIHSGYNGFVEDGESREIVGFNSTGWHTVPSYIYDCADTNDVWAWEQPE